MKIDILDHLRAEASYHYTGLFNEAADEIQRLRTALHDIIDNVGGHHHWDEKGTHGANCPICIRQFEAKERARLALTGT